MPKVAPQIKSRRVIHQARPITLAALNVQNSSGSQREYLTVEHPGAVVIVPQLSEHEVLLLRQFRVSLNRYIFEFPAGTLDPNETPLDCAKRELIEETGYQAAEWIPLGTTVPAPGFCNEVQHLFLARQLTPGPSALEEDEVIEPIAVSLDALTKLINSGELEDGKSLAALAKCYAARRFSIS